MSHNPKKIFGKTRLQRNTQFKNLTDQIFMPERLAHKFAKLMDHETELREQYRSVMYLAKCSESDMQQKWLGQMMADDIGEELCEVECILENTMALYETSLN